MGLIKVLYRSALALAISAGTARAQSIELGAGFNHLSNGFHLMYQLPSSSRWTFGAGLRIMVNMYSLNINDESAVYYQSGYASKYWENLGLTGKSRYRIFKYKRIGLDATGNLLLTWHGLKANYKDIPSLNGGYWNDVVYTKPGLALEAVIAPNLYFDISKRVRLNVASGLGVVLMNYSRYQQSLVTGLPIRRVRLSEYQGRLDLEYVGLGGGLPMMYIGVTYKLP